MGYPSDILSTRAVIRPGKYVVIPPEGLVNNNRFKRYSYRTGL